MGDSNLLLNFLPVRVGVATVDALNMVALREWDDGARFL